MGLAGTIGAKANAPARRTDPPPTNVLDKLFLGSRLHEHADPARRVAGVSSLPPESDALVQLLRADPSADVRAAAAQRCAVASVLAAALRAESDARVRAAVVAALGAAIAATRDDGTVRALLVGPDCTDLVRAQVALRAPEESTRRAAVDALEDQALLTDVALAAEHAALRIAAAERVHAPEQLQRLFEGAKDKDRGVARLVRERLQAIERRATQAQAADALLNEAEALVSQSGPVVMAAVELDRRWRKLDLDGEAERLARWETISQRLRQRFERELEEQRGRSQFAQRLAGWLASLTAAPETTALPSLREELGALRADAARFGNDADVARLDGAEQQLLRWEQAVPRLAAAEALVAEAEQLAAGTQIDDDQLPARWQALDAEARTPALSQRMEAALLVVEQRRLALIRANQQEQVTARHELHTLLHQAELALAAGQLHEARTAADRARALKLHAGTLPKPSMQRLSRVVNQLVELERWQHFGQQGARVQLAERAEALPARALTPTALAREVQQLRAEWKKLDQEHAGVPKALWERFDSACEKAYAPAAKHFAEQAAVHKQARKQREEFIEAAAAHAATLPGEAPDWRAIEHWLRDTDAAWRGSNLGSVEPGAWKKLDARLKAALAPLRTALADARRQAVQQREALIAEAEAMVPKAMERDVPTRVKELQARWQTHAKSIVLQQRDERALWERFRTAFQSVFDARTGQRKESDERRHAQRRAFETVCEQMEALAQSTADDAEVRRARHEVQDQWRKAINESGPAPAPVEARFKSAVAGVDQLLRGRSRKSEAVTWQALLAKEQLCEELDARSLDDAESDAIDAESIRQRWSELPALSADREKLMVARRDAALRALDDADAREDHADQIRDGAAARGDVLLELELMLGIPSPPDLQARRLAVQVKELRDRFKRTASAAAESAPDLLVRWCALPGVADARDRDRCEAIVARLARG